MRSLRLVKHRHNEQRTFHPVGARVIKMKSIKLEPGWLERQMAEVREECKNWPKILDPLRSLNADLVIDNHQTRNVARARDE